MLKNVESQCVNLDVRGLVVDDACVSSTVDSIVEHSILSPLESESSPFWGISL